LKSALRFDGHFLAFVFCLLFFGLTPATAEQSIATTTTTETSGDSANVSAADRRSEIRRWIDRLASDSYATRVRAKNYLQQLGLDAFDELHAAQHHSDIEVEMACRYLISSLMVSWAKESDPPAVKRTLQQYGSQSEIERSSRIMRLGQMDPPDPLAALVRLTRFETSPRLSELAALELMKQTMVDDPLQRRRMSETIDTGLGDADRPSVAWLRVYAKDLRDGEYSASDWRSLIDEQRDKIDAESAHPSTRQSVLELVRICASRSADLGDRGEAIDLATEHLDLIQPTSAKLVDAATWAIDHDLHPVVLSLREQFQRMFDQRPILLYTAAEAFDVQGLSEKATTFADQALNQTPMPKGPAAEKMSARERQEIAQAHLDMAKHLERRGRFDWAIREYNEIIDAVDVGSWESAVARLSASRMLGELLRHQEVVDVLQPFVDRLDKDEKLRISMQYRRFSLKQIRSELEFHAAQALLASGKMNQARSKLALAYAKSNKNIDILIRMYRTQGDDAWRNEVRRHLELAIRSHQKDIDSARTRLQTRRLKVSEELAELLNNYAWLVSNTEGDYQKALRYSKESLTIEKDGAKYDTCARCYFAVGEIENAIESQKKAMKLMPNSPPLERQLKEFQQALAAKQ
jgi:tetratricopeptide (TPR) repeat protein